MLQCVTTESAANITQ